MATFELTFVERNTAKRILDIWELSYSAICFAVKGGSSVFALVEEILECITIQIKKLFSGTSLWCYLLYLYKIVLTFASVAEILIWKPCHVTIQKKATEQNVPVVVFVIMYKIVLTFASGA